MNERKPKIIKREDAERRKDNERSLEVNYMLMLMRKYPDKAREAVRKMSHHWAVEVFN